MFFSYIDHEILSFKSFCKSRNTGTSYLAVITCNLHILKLKLSACVISRDMDSHNHPMHAQIDFC